MPSLAARAVHESGRDLLEAGAELGLEALGAEAQFDGGQLRLRVVQMVMRFAGIAFGRRFRWGGRDFAGGRWVRRPAAGPKEWGSRIR